MTEIPERQEGQTWANYFIERLKERGISTEILLDNVRDDFALEQENLEFVLESKTEPTVEISLGYILSDKNNEDACEMVSSGFAKVPDLNYKYSNDLAIRVTDSEDGEVYLHVFNDYDTLCDIDATGKIASILPIYKDLSIGDTVPDIPAAEIFCVIADYIKQRQDFYKSEGEK